jgi:hypothetical protein
MTYSQRLSSASDVSISLIRGLPASVLLNNISFFPNHSFHLSHFGVMFVGSDLMSGFSSTVKSVNAWAKAFKNAWLLYGGEPLSKSVKKSLYANFLDVRRKVVRNVAPVITRRNRELSLWIKESRSVGQNRLGRCDKP